MIACVSVALVLSCGPNVDDGDEPPSFEATELGEIAGADESSFDVDWAEDTVVVDESAVLADLEDLQPWDSVYRVPAGSELLDGIDQGSIVVWPQVGIFEIVEIRDDGEMVEIETKWARFSDAAERADIQFRHALQAGAPGRVVGMRPAPVQANQLQSRARQSLSAEAGPVKFSEKGVTYSAGNTETTIGIDGDAINVSFSLGAGSVTGKVTGTVSGLTAEGLVFLDPNAEEPDPSVLIKFDNLRADVNAKLEIKGAEGTDEIIPPAVLVFPFTVGPVPAFIAIGLRFQIRSTIARDQTVFSVESGFSIDGEVTLARNDDGGFGAEGTIENFDPRGPEMSFETQTTAGIGLDVDSPRISFGLGRPGLASASVFGTHSFEIVGNVTVDARERDYCATISTAGAIVAGGEIAAFGWSSSATGDPIDTKAGGSNSTGGACE